METAVPEVTEEGKSLPARSQVQTPRPCGGTQGQQPRSLKRDRWIFIGTEMDAWILFSLLQGKLIPQN